MPPDIVCCARFFRALDKLFPLLLAWFKSPIDCDGGSQRSRSDLLFRTARTRSLGLVVHGICCVEIDVAHVCMFTYMHDYRVNRFPDTHVNNKHFCADCSGGLISTYE